MSNDVEMNNVPLLEKNSEKLNNDVDVPEVEFKEGKSEKIKKEEFTGLTKEELEIFANDPFWKKLRLALFILFWIIWIGMLVAAILIVVFTPRCPTRPKLQFWQKKAGYRLNPYAFKDSNGDGVGDINGLLSKLNYIQKDLGAEYLIIDSIFNGYWTNKDGSKRLDLIEGFRDIDKVLGTEEEFTKFLRECRKLGIEVVLSADFNGLSPSSNLFIKFQDSRVQSKNLKSDWVNREGKPILTNLFYAAVPGKDDLNLNDKEIVQELKDSVKFWLEKGVMGFLLTNVPFYVENRTTGYTESGEINETNKWFKVKQINSQIFTDSTVDFLKEIRMVINEVAKKTDKPRLLMVEPGQIGFAVRLNNDEMLKYLTYNDTTTKKEVALIDVVISREFQPNRGLATDRILHIPSLQLYNDSIPDALKSKVALTAGSPFANNKAVNDKNSLLELSAPFLLPGSPIIYYGEELGRRSCDKNMSSDIFPKDRKFPLDSLQDQSGLGKCSNSPMLWDDTGKEFSANLSMTAQSVQTYFSQFKNTVKGMTAKGREETVFQLLQKLIKLRSKEPSMLWGNVQKFLDETRNNIKYQIFLRKAEGYPSIVVAVVSSNIDPIPMSGRAISFDSVCKEIRPLLIYPNNPLLDPEVTIPARNVYLGHSVLQSIHIFKCQ